MPDDLNDEYVTINKPPTFLSALQRAADNICPAGGQHESASDRYMLAVYESSEPHEAHVYCCRKCSALYWLRKDTNQSSSTNSHS